MELKDFYERYPCPPPIGRGQRKNTSLALSEDEYDFIIKLVDRVDTRRAFDGTVQNFIRWLVYYHGQQVQGAVDSATPLFLALERDLEVANLEINFWEIDGYLDKKARGLALLVEAEMPEQALKMYAQLLTFAMKQPYPWNKALLAKVAKHPELDRFREEVAKLDPEGLHEAQKLIE